MANNDSEELISDKTLLQNQELNHIQKHCRTSTKRFNWTKIDIQKLFRDQKSLFDSKLLTIAVALSVVSTISLLAVVENALKFEYRNFYSLRKYFTDEQLSEFSINGNQLSVRIELFRANDNRHNIYQNTIQ